MPSRAKSDEHATRVDRAKVLARSHAAEQLGTLIKQQEVAPHAYEFESLLGLGTEQVDGLQRRGLPTREYAVFGEEYFLYVLNRIAEDPIRLHQAVIDALEKCPSDSA